MASAAPGLPTIAYIKGNYGGLTAKTLTGNTVYVLAVPSIVTNTGTIIGGFLEISTNSLSGTLLFNGKNLASASSFNPNVVVFSGASLPTSDTGGLITNMMNNLKTAYSGSDIATNSSIATLISTASGNLAQLGNSVVLAQLGGTTNGANGNTVTACSAGTYSASGNAPCTTASAGYYASGAGATTQTQCPANSYCPAGSASPTACGGSLISPAGSTNSAACTAPVTNTTLNTRGYYVISSGQHGTSCSTVCGAAGKTCTDTNLRNFLSDFKVVYATGNPYSFLTTLGIAGTYPSNANASSSFAYKGIVLGCSSGNFTATPGAPVG